MTQRKSKKIPQPNSAIASAAPKQPIEAVKPESNTKVASKPKTPIKAPQGATGVAKKARTRTKKAVVVEKPVPPEGKVVSEATYVAPNRAILVAEPPPSLYDRFVGWLCRVTYNFRGY
jgi:hypothetical protein